MQSGADALFRRAIEAHAAASDNSNGFAREDGFQRAEELVDAAKRLLGLAKVEAERLHLKAARR